MRYPELHGFLSRLHPIPAGEWEKAGMMFAERALRKGEFFARAGEEPRHFAVVRSGFFRLYYQDGEGKEYTKAFRGPWSFIGPYAEMLLGRSSLTYVVATEDSRVFAAEFPRLVSLYEEHACWQAVGRKIAEGLYLEKLQREFEFLQLSARERYDAFVGEFPEYARKVPQYQIASYLGVTPVGLSRLVGKSSRSEHARDNHAEIRARRGKARG